MSDSDTEIIEDDLDEGDSVHIAEKFKKIRTELRECKQDKDKHLDALQRARADLVNVRRAGEQERIEYGGLVERRLLLELLEIADNFERALPAGRQARLPDGQARSSGDRDALWQGVEQIYGQLFKLLISHNVTKIDSIGKQLDPAFHETVGEVAVDQEDQDHIIHTVVRDGYMIGDRVLRAAQVTIGKFIK